MWMEMAHLSVVDNQLEEGVHQQDSIWQDAAAVQEHGLWRVQITTKKTLAVVKIKRGLILVERRQQWHEGCEADLWWSIEGVWVEDGLDHDQGLREVLPDEVVPVIGRLVRAVVEHLQEGRPPQVEHELRVEDRGERLLSVLDIINPGIGVAKAEQNRSIKVSLQAQWLVLTWG